MTKTSTEDRIEVVRAAVRLERAVFGAALQFRNLMHQRKGQALMNALRCEAPELYDILAGTPQDCFHDDNRYHLTIEELGFHHFSGMLDEEPPVRPLVQDNQEWCNFCGWIPRHGYHRWGQHTNENYKPTPTNA